MRSKNEFPRKGPFKILYSNSRGKKVIEQTFTNPRDSSEDNYILFDMGKAPSIVLPLTPKNEVIVLRQYRRAADSVIYELPGGGPKNGESPEEVAAQELFEETGYKADVLIDLNTNCKNWFDPTVNLTPYHSFLALDCAKVSDPKPDKDEFFEVELIPIRAWIETLFFGQVDKDSKTVTTTFLAMPHIGIKIRY